MCGTEHLQKVKNIFLKGIDRNTCAVSFSFSAEAGLFSDCATLLLSHPKAILQHTQKNFCACHFFLRFMLFVTCYKCSGFQKGLSKFRRGLSVVKPKFGSVPFLSHRTSRRANACLLLNGDAENLSTFFRALIKSIRKKSRAQYISLLVYGVTK